MLSVKEIDRKWYGCLRAIQAGFQDLTRNIYSCFVFKGHFCGSFGYVACVINCYFSLVAIDLSFYKPDIHLHTDNYNKSLCKIKELSVWCYPNRSTKLLICTLSTWSMFFRKIKSRKIIKSPCLLCLSYFLSTVWKQHQ